MDRQNRKTKNTLKALIVIGGILILALIGALVYFYLQPDREEGEDELSKITCGCYMIDPNVVNECGDPRRAFLFNLNTVSSDKTCKATCDINDLADNLLNSSTPNDSYKVCTMRSISDTRCENMILRDQDEKIITGRIKPTDNIIVEATFDKSEYTDYMFEVNSEDAPPDSVDGNKITKTLTDLEGITSVEIMATANDSQGNQINSLVCRRIVEIETGISSAVTDMTIITEKQDDGTTKISQITIAVGQVSSSNIKIQYSFNNGAPTLTAENGIVVESSKGSISMSKLDLYDEANFTANSFNVLNEHTGELEITAEVFQDEISIGSTSKVVTFAEPTGETPVVPGEEPEPDPEQPYSEFSVTKDVEQDCIERTEGNNSATFTLTIVNNREDTEYEGTTPDEVVSVTDSLPFGFTYTANSTTIDNVPVSDSSLVSITQVGDSEKIVWQPSSPWVIEPAGRMKIAFRASAGSSTIGGQNLNEVVVNPTEIPLDPALLRSQVSLTVANDCDNITEEELEPPATGIFDTFSGRIAVGLIVLAIGWLIYTSPQGNILTEKILSTKMYDKVEMLNYKFTNPKKYFEEKFLREDSKRSNRKSKR
jgi:hypothetical protein